LSRNYKKGIAAWLLIGVFMIMVQVLLGGLTRLTGSGLSITEWKPIMGALPPLTEAEWQKAFRGYQQIAQYKYLNSDFSLQDFKFIFFWEWFHRLWARLLGVVFIIGFFYFLAKKAFSREMLLPFIILFILGGLQGFVGWIMVKSGLNDTSLYVNHVKLAIHFIAALILLCYTLWFALDLLIEERNRVQSKSLFSLTVISIAVLTVQLIYGAFMAGLKAAPYAPTWPKMNGVWVPDTISSASWINNHFNVQFFHRGLAYTLLIVIITWLVKARNLSSTVSSSIFRKALWWPGILVIIQVLLGIFTVLMAPKMGASSFGGYEMLAEAHQLMAMCLLVALVVNLNLVKKTGYAG
jgi:heme a synthase